MANSFPFLLTSLMYLAFINNYQEGQLAGLGGQLRWYNNTFKWI